MMGLYDLSLPKSALAAYQQAGVYPLPEPAPAPMSAAAPLPVAAQEPPPVVGDVDLAMRALDQYEGRQPAPQPVPAAPAAPATLTPAQGQQQAIAQLGEGQAMREQAHESMAQSAMDAGAQRGVQLEQRNEQLGQDDVARQRIADEEAREVQSLRADYDRLNNEIGSAQVTDRRSTADRAMGVLGVALGAIGDAFNHRGGGNSNHANDILGAIDAQVRRDMDEQRDQLNRKGKLADSKLTQIGLAERFFGDKQKALEYAANTRKEQYLNEAERVAVNLDSETAKARAMEAIAKGRQDVATKSAEIYQSLEAQRLARVREARITTGAGVGHGDPYATLTQQELEALDALNKLPAAAKAQYLKPAQQADNAANEAARKAASDARAPAVIAGQKGGRLTQDLVVDDPDLAQTAASTPAAVEKMQQAVDAARQLVTITDRILQTRKDNPVARSLPFTDAKANLESDGGAMNIQLKTLNELGVLNGPDLGLLLKQAGDATGVMGDNDTKLRALQKQIEDKTNAHLVARGFSRPQLRETQNPRNNDGPAGTTSSPAPGLSTLKWD